MFEMSAFGVDRQAKWLDTEPQASASSWVARGRPTIAKLTDALIVTASVVLLAIDAMLAILLVSGPAALMAQNTAGDYTAGTNALTTVAEEIAKYVPIMVKLCYAIAGVVAIVGAISVYIAMNNEEQDVKKKIMMVVGACIFLIAAAQALPLFFGIGG